MKHTPIFIAIIVCCFYIAHFLQSCAPDCTDNRSLRTYLGNGTTAIITDSCVIIVNYFTNEITTIWDKGSKSKSMFKIKNGIVYCNSSDTTWLDKTPDEGATKAK